MKDILKSIATAREWIIIYGLLFFGSIGFIYSNIAIFTLISSEGLEIPRLFLIIFYAYPKWIIIIGLTFVIQLFYSAYLMWKGRKK